MHGRDEHGLNLAGMLVNEKPLSDKLPLISSSCPEDIWMTQGQYDECLATVPNLKVLVLPKGVGIWGMLSDSCCAWLTIQLSDYDITLQLPQATWVEDVRHAYCTSLQQSQRVTNIVTGILEDVMEDQRQLLNSAEKGILQKEHPPQAAGWPISPILQEKCKL